MSLSDKSGINLISGFKLHAEKPLDIRYTVNTEAERDALVTDHAAYPGLRVFVKELNNSYVYNGSIWELMTTGIPYVHPSNDGNLHVPATGVNHNGDVLVAGDEPGKFSWKHINYIFVGAAPEKHTHLKSEITDLVIPTVLPNPKKLNVSFLKSDGSIQVKRYDGSSQLDLDLSPAALQAASKKHSHTKSEITDFPESIKNPNSLQISLNGIKQPAYDGSIDRNINIAPDNIGASPIGHTHTKSEITDFPESMKTPNPFNIYLGNNTTPSSFNGDKKVELRITPDSIGASNKNHTHNVGEISGVPVYLPNQFPMAVSLNGVPQPEYNGSSRVEFNITPSSIGASASNHTHNYAGSTSVGGAANSVAHTFQIKINGGASEGTNQFTFDGSSTKSINITPNLIGASPSGHTHNYAGSASVGGAANSVANNIKIQLNGGASEGTNQFTYNGSSAKNINITPSSIGASPSGHTHNYAGSTSVGGAANSVANNIKIQLNGGTVEDTNQFTYNGSTIKNINITPSSIGASASNHTHKYAGSASVGGAANSVANNIKIQLNGGTSEGANQFTYNGSGEKNINITPSSIGASPSGHTHNYAGSSTVGGIATSANKVVNNMKIQLNGGTTEDTNQFTYNGSSAKNINITPASIGASASNHTHNYAGSTSVGGAANKVANAIKIQLNSGTSEGSSQFTFDGSGSKNINITPSSIGASASNHTHNYAGSASAGGAATVANKVNNSIKIQLNGGTTEGTNQFTYNGSSAKNINITPSSIGASSSGHTHPYAGSATAGGAASKVAHTVTIKCNGGTTEGSNMITFDGSANKTLNITPSSIGASASNHTHNYAGSSSAGGAATVANKVNMPVGTCMWSTLSSGTLFQNQLGGTWEVVGSLQMSVNSSSGATVTIYLFKKTAA